MVKARQGGDKITRRGEEDRTSVDVDREIDALFQLPSAEFTPARNALAARLKKAGRREDSERVRSLTKPSVSAWAVNQLYWNQRAAFDQLLAAGESVGRAHASQLTGQAADTRGPLASRREAISALAHLAASLLRAGDHNPTPDKMLRIASTLEAVSTRASTSGTAPDGRLTADLDPPGRRFQSEVL